VIAVSCPSCGGGLQGTQGRTLVVCPFCGVEVKLSLTPIETMQRMLEKRAALDPKMKVLMERYAEHLGASRKQEALVYYEAFTYLVCSLSYDVEDLVELEPMVTPLMRDAARQIGAAYIAPVDRGERVTFASVEALVA
jgi:hypothetical protein